MTRDARRGPAAATTDPLDHQSAPHTDPLSVTQLLRAYVEELAGGSVYGGCDECDAYQTMLEDEHGFFHVTVHHDDWCAFWRRRRRAS